MAIESAASGLDATGGVLVGCVPAGRPDQKAGSFESRHQCNACSADWSVGSIRPDENSAVDGAFVRLISIRSISE
jgi:hypothetical protein